MSNFIATDKAVPEKKILKGSQLRTFEVVQKFQYQRVGHEIRL